ncbi:hypothetical protein [Vibrio vulnificus]|uniref:hypothetical protein n=1 Tax=Vibrio vulnificus TaxID=672 RepID=UPI001CDC9C03|nr:hypothetical protein [Vibrio vulnificus]MCA4019847.1 hypothetical protein [Vibrio vulnificus]
MNSELNLLWYEAVKSAGLTGLVGDKGCRLASKYGEAKSWVLGASHPIGTTAMRSNVQLYHGWDCPVTLGIAKALVTEYPRMTLRELQVRMLKLAKDGEAIFPYIWWVYTRKASSDIRAIHEDQNGLLFVKLKGKWMQVYQCQKLGSLVGSQGNHYEDFPSNAYFVLWENEEQARNHAS